MDIRPKSEDFAQQGCHHSNSIQAGKVREFSAPGNSAAGMKSAAEFYPGPLPFQHETRSDAPAALGLYRKIIQAISQPLRQFEQEAVLLRLARVFQHQLSLCIPDLNPDYNHSGGPQIDLQSPGSRVGPNH